MNAAERESDDKEKHKERIHSAQIIKAELRVLDT